MPKRLTDKEYRERFYSKYSEDEYSLLSTFNGRKKPIKIRHNKCSHPSGIYEWTATMAESPILERTKGCPYCFGSAKLTEERLIELCDSLNLEYVGGLIDSNHKFIVHCRKCNGYSSKYYCDLRKGSGCPYCSVSNGKVLVGYNDMWTTNPGQAKYLSDAQDGYNYKYGTGKYLDFTCPRCKSVTNKQPILIFDKDGHYKCPFCGDGVSYPEKFFYNVLSQLGVEFIYQLTSKKADWCNRFMYDFYIKDKNAIIETNGIQHYKDSNWGKAEDIIANDNSKRDLALKFGIKNYIQLDMSESHMEFCKSAIENSLLSEWYDLSKIDWEQCAIFASNSLLPEVCKLWISGESMIFEIAQKFPMLNKSTIRNYLVEGTKLGLCNYDQKEYNKRKNLHTGRCASKPVMCVETGIVYESRIDAVRKTGINGVRDVVDNQNKTRGGYHWISVENEYRTKVIEEMGELFGR